MPKATVATMTCTSPPFHSLNDSRRFFGVNPAWYTPQQIPWSRNRRVEFRILRTAAGVTRERIVCPAGEALMPEEDRNLQ